MMTVTYCYVTLVLSLLTGGGNDLLDYAPTEAYWRAKEVDVTFGAMLAELTERPGGDVTKLIPELGSPDAETRDKAALRIREVGGAAVMKPLAEAADSPDAEVRRRARTLLRQIGGDEIERGVRRLMAVRTLGEMGKPEAIDKIKPLLQSKELFVADYARAAIDLIEGRRAGDARGVAPGVAEDVWLLPAECRTVGQLVPRHGAPVGFSEFMATAKAGAAKRPDGDKRAERTAAMLEDNAEAVTQMVVSLADKIGNVRIDAVTFGVAGTLVPVRGKDGKPAAGGDTGHVALVVRGRYHSEWVRTLARSEQVPAQDVGGVEVFQPNGEMAWMAPADDLFVFAAAPADVDRPVKALAAAVKQGKPTPHEQTRKLIESVDTKQVLWAAAALTPEQQQLPVAEAFDALTLLGTREGRTLTLKLTARGSDAAKVKAAVDRVNKHAKDAVEFMAAIHGIPLIDLSVEFLKTVRANVDGTSATVTAKLEATPAAILSFPDVNEDEPRFREESPAHPRLKPEYAK